MSNFFLCDICERLIEYQPGDFVVQDASYCPRLSHEKLVIQDNQKPEDICKKFLTKRS